MKLFRITDDKNIEVIQEYSYRDNDVGGFGEVTMQELLTDYPELIPSEEINTEDPPKFLVIKREAGVTAGSIDLLLVDHKGVPTVIETKLIDNREIRRSVLAQGVEYLAHLKTEWTSQRIYEEGQEFWLARDSDIDNEALKRLEVSFDEEFLEKITSNINQNKMRLIISADKIPPELRRIIEFLNDASAFDIFGIEIGYFAAKDNKYRILVPHLVGYSETTKERKLKSNTSRWNYDRFFGTLSDSCSKDEMNLAERLLQWGEEITGREADWGSGKVTGSFSVRLVIGKEKFNLFYVTTLGEVYLTIGWNTYNFNKLGLDFPVGYIEKVKQAFSIDFTQKKWEAGSITLKLSGLLDNQEMFTTIISNFVADTRGLLLR